MKRRQLLSTTLAATGLATIAGCSGTGDLDGDDGQFPSHDVPGYARWVPEASRGTETGTFFAHLDWTALEELEGDDPRTDDETEALLEEAPILGLPMYGGLIAPFAAFGIMFYPFSGDILPEDGQDIDGIATDSVTWTENVLVFHGTYDPELFVAQYSEEFEQADERNGYTVYVTPEELAYAVSEDAVVVAIQSGDDGYRPKAVVEDALERRLDEVDRTVDTDDGRWLFETTGDAAMAFGVWNVESFDDALEPAEEIDAGDEPGVDLDAGGNPVLGDLEGFVATLVVDAEDGELLETEARFSGLYPEDSVPAESMVRDHLVGEDVSHEIALEGNRVHASATFEELPS
ncbi:hypothetical protein [Natronococcus roseus]|uniref:hypothetical protein n=1 Tax=Natronococcus roseus TaxID=1052014 RepID=UPI00374D2196